MKPTNALIGYSGFLGISLLGQARFESLYRSTNISDIDGQSFDTVVCLGAPAQKWIANREPEADRQKIDGLMAHLETIQCKTFILISTVDVFISPIAVDESTPVDERGLHAYGLHRHLLEKFVESRFADHLIVRLPGLVGPGLRKNIIFLFFPLSQLPLQASVLGRQLLLGLASTLLQACLGPPTVYLRVMQPELLRRLRHADPVGQDQGF